MLGKPTPVVLDVPWKTGEEVVAETETINRMKDRVAVEEEDDDEFGGAKRGGRYRYRQRTVLTSL